MASSLSYTYTIADANMGRTDKAIIKLWANYFISLTEILLG